MYMVYDRCRSGSEHCRRLLAGVVFLLMPSIAWAQVVLPTGGNVVSGQAAIGPPNGGMLTVTQSSSKAVIDWNSFSVGPNATVNFVQPGSSAAVLNRVVGSTPSTIAGQIRGNGEVLLVNPNGIAITSSGSVQVGGGFVASTLDVRNADFASGRLSFSGNSTAGISNAGTISAAPSGFVGLIGAKVANSGTITVPLGRVGLGAAQQATIDPTGDGFLQVVVPAGSRTADGRALIDVSGRIRADGGLVEIKAATAEQAVRNAVNVSGVVSARSVSGRNGSIVLDGGAGGATVVSGKLLATGSRNAKGGAIVVTGRTVALRGALLDSSGGTGGGSALVGVDARGLNRATTTIVDRSSVIRADAGVKGDGGNITVWADDSTSFAGHISARGGMWGGDGGDAEVSGKAHLTLGNGYASIALADLSAPAGKTGTLRFDPGTVNIVDQASVFGAVLNGPDTFTSQFISAQLGFANVSISTNNATGANGSAGDINLLSNARIAWTTGNRLTLDAARNINFAPGASIIGLGLGAGLTLRAGTSGSGDVNFASGIQASLPLGSIDLSSAGVLTVGVIRGSLSSGGSPIGSGLPLLSPLVSPTISGNFGVLDGVANLSRVISTGPGSPVFGAIGTGNGSQLPRVAANVGSGITTAPKEAASQPALPRDRAPTIVPPEPPQVPQVSTAAGSTRQSTAAADCAEDRISGEQASSLASSVNCEGHVAKKNASGIDFALPKLNRNALFDAFDLKLREASQSQLATRSTLVKIAAGASLALSAGVVSWLLHSGLMVGGLLSTAPLWRGFDPMVVVINRRRRGERRLPLSRLDMLFEKISIGNPKRRFLR